METGYLRSQTKLLGILEQQEAQEVQSHGPPPCGNLGPCQLLPLSPPWINGWLAGGPPAPRLTYRQLIIQMEMLGVGVGGITPLTHQVRLAVGPVGRRLLGRRIGM